MTDKFNQLIIEQAMHIADGLTTSTEDRTFQDVLEIWDKGCLELFSFASQFAEPAAKLLQEKFDENEGLSGVFEYEVSCMFGMWLSYYIIEHKDAPTVDMCNKELNDLASEFFSQD